MTKRFFYNPYSKKLSLFESDHVTFFHNRKNELGASFDEFIRGIIFENKILLRVFYPYSNINELSFSELLEKSGLLLNAELPAIKKALKREGVKAENFVLNVTNESAKNLLNSLYV
jgi:hypothetical protein